MASAAALAPVKKKKIYDSETELALVHRAKRGDKEAFSVLYTQHLHRTKRVIIRIVQNEDTADDVANTAMMKAWLKIAFFAEGSKFNTWITRIAMNEALMHVRKRVPEWGIDNVELDNIENQSSLHAVQAALTHRDLSLEGIADRQVLILALARVPLMFREILRLRYWEDCSLEEIRVIVGANTIPAIKTRLQRGRKLLIEQIKSFSTTRLPELR